MPPSFLPSFNGVSSFLISQRSCFPPLLSYFASFCYHITHLSVKYPATKQLSTPQRASPIIHASQSFIASSSSSFLGSNHKLLLLATLLSLLLHLRHRCQHLHLWLCLLWLFCVFQILRRTRTLRLNRRRFLDCQERGRLGRDGADVFISVVTWIALWRDCQPNSSGTDVLHRAQ